MSMALHSMSDTPEACEAAPRMDMASSQVVCKSMVDESGVERKLEIRPSDGFFNATLMCRSFGKLFNSYYRPGDPLKSRGGAYLVHLLPILAEQHTPLITIATCGKAKGTWVAPQIATDLAYWLSPEFGAWVTILVCEHLTGRGDAPDNVNS